MKKSLVLGLVLSLMIFSVGCGQDENKSSSETKTSSQQEVIESNQVDTDSVETTTTEETNQTKEIDPDNETPIVQATDIAGHPVEVEISQLIEKGTIKLKEDGKFRPDDMITRGELIQWLYNFDSHGVKPHNSLTPSFKDLPKEHPQYKMIEGLKSGGYMMSAKTMLPKSVLWRKA